MKNFLLLAATKGIGLGIAKHILLKNHNIFIGSRNLENLEQAKSLLNKEYENQFSHENFPFQ